ncbi:MAG: chitobiase/beta-hexosaminidase C-terminal domain-containing protein [Polyangiaceae bacterium]|nr:chitobiase/beta-hexosaminidase C-terminal domain-containing protein [Polyangiaceae bacterium]
MRLLLTSLLVLASVGAAGAAQAACDGSRSLSDASTKECTRDGMFCAYWEPPTNDPNTKYPLVIFLHGAGASVGCAQGQDANFKWQVDDGYTCQLQEVMDNRTAYPAYVMAPRAPNCDNTLSENPNSASFVLWDWANVDSYDITTLGESKTLQTTRAMIQSLQAQYPNIDPDRIYVTGVSMGGFGAWDMIARTPNFFAAGVPADGGGSPQAASSMKNMAVWSFHAAGDTGVPVASDRLMFETLAKAGGRPYYTEAVAGGHGTGMYLASDEGFVPWMFAQRRGVPATSASPLTFSPEGGELAGPSVTVTLTTTPQSDSVYYTTNGTIPNPVTHVGTQYAGPFTLTSSAIVIAAAHSSVGGNEVIVYHAAPFKVGDSPLPAGAELMPYTPYVPPVGSTGGASSGTGGATATGGASSGLGGASNSGGASNPNPFPPSAGGRPAAAGGASSGSGGAKPSTSGGAGSVPAANTPGTTRNSSGCSLAGTDPSGNSMLTFGMASVWLAAFAGRRRQGSFRS